MKPQIGYEMPGINIYFNIWQNWACRFVSSGLPDAHQPLENSFEFSSVWGRKHHRDTEFEQKWVTSKFSKDFNVLRHRTPPWYVTLDFVLQWLNNKKCDGMTVKYTHYEHSDLLLILGTCNSLLLVLVLVPVLDNARTLMRFNSCSTICVRQEL
jgi:hypothetical protein